MYCNQREYILSLEIHRDGLYSPWGFRLKGGIDVDGGTPLEIVKVFVGTASEGLLMPGDRVVGINHQDTSKLTHLEAQSLIKSAGTAAKIDVVRQGTGGGVFIDTSNGNPERQFETSKVQSQPFRTTPLVSPSPKTINEVGRPGAPKQNERIPPQPMSPTFGSPPTYGSPTFGQQHVKTVNIGGSPKQVVSTQFNSPINIYSDDAIASEAAYNQQHPGFVPSSKPHLPTPKDLTHSRPQASETFKLILQSEMDKARDHPQASGSEFTKDKQVSRPSSVMSNKSNSTQDPFMINNNINQSTSFKRLILSFGRS